MSPGDQIAQACHAAAKFMDWQESSKVEDKWFSDSTIIVLAVPDENHIDRWRKKIRLMDGTAPISWREPDMNNHLTAIAYATRNEHLFSKLPLALLNIQEAIN